MKRLLGVALAVGLLSSCAGPMEINQSGTSGGKAAATQPGGDVINISVVIEKKDDIKDALDVVGQVENFIPDLPGKLPSLPAAPESKPEPAAPVFPDVAPPTAPTEEIAKPEGLEDVIPPQGTVEEVD